MAGNLPDDLVGEPLPDDLQDETVAPHTASALPAFLQKALDRSGGAIKQNVAEPIPAWRAAVLGGSQGATAGLADELGGAVGQFAPRGQRANLTPAAFAEAQKLGLHPDLPPKPGEAPLDKVGGAMRAEYAQALRDQPAPTMIGQAMGALGTDAVTGMVAGPATVASPAYQAGMGALSAYGGSDAPALSPERLAAAAGGGLVGSAAGAVGVLAGNPAGALAKSHYSNALDRLLAPAGAAAEAGQAKAIAKAERLTAQQLLGDRASAIDDAVANKTADLASLDKYNLAADTAKRQAEAKDRSVLRGYMKSAKGDILGGRKDVIESNQKLLDDVASSQAELADLADSRRGLLGREEQRAQEAFRTFKQTLRKDPNTPEDVLQRLDALESDIQRVGIRRMRDPDAQQLANEAYRNREVDIQQRLARATDKLKAAQPDALPDVAKRLLGEDPMPIPEWQKLARKRLVEARKAGIDLPAVPKPVGGPPAIYPAADRPIPQPLTADELNAGVAAKSRDPNYLLTKLGEPGLAKDVVAAKPTQEQLIEMLEKQAAAAKLKRQTGAASMPSISQELRSAITNMLGVNAPARARRLQTAAGRADSLIPATFASGARQTVPQDEARSDVDELLARLRRGGR